MSEVKAVKKTEMPEINAKAAIVVTTREGRILLEKNARAKMYPAFITKILAAIIALEKCNPGDLVTISKSVVNEIARWKGSASINLTEGERISVLDLVYSMMLVSANDSMFALAEFISGGKDEFTALMEQKAKAIGANETTLLDEKGHFTAEQFSTAYDMAIICRYCMNNSTFRLIAAADKYTIPPTNTSPERIIQNTNLLINKSNRRYRYETAIGIKSGYTNRSKACLACAALPKKDKFGEEILAIILGAENTKQMKYVFYDAITLFDFTFDNYEMLSGKKPGEEEVSDKNALLTISEICTALMPSERYAGEGAVNGATFGKFKVKPGYAYFATDRESAENAVKNGAALIISEENYSGLPCIVVDSIEKAKVMLAGLVKSKLGMWSIGVADCPDRINPLNMAAYMLNEKGKGKAIKSILLVNNYENVLKTILTADNGTASSLINVSFAVKDNAAAVAQAAAFDVAILQTAAASLNPRELSKSQMTEEKLSMLSGMNESGAVIINIDDKNLAGIFSIGQDVITIGVDNRMADYVADNISIAQGKISFDILTGDKSYKVEVYAEEKHAVYQALATFALGIIMGIPPKSIISSIESYRNTGGLNIVKNERNMQVLSDFDLDTGESVGTALKKLCTIPVPEGARRFAILSDMGGDSDYEKEIFRKVGRSLVSSPIDVTVAFGENAAAVCETAELKRTFVIKLNSKAALLEFLKLNLADGDAVLFKGSRDSELDEIMTETT